MHDADGSGELTFIDAYREPATPSRLASLNGASQATLVHDESLRTLKRSRTVAFEVASLELDAALSRLHVLVRATSEDSTAFAARARSDRVATPSPFVRMWRVWSADSQRRVKDNFVVQLAGNAASGLVQAALALTERLQGATTPIDELLR